MRTHIVMVPGFGGFDALGSLQYYAGVTKHFGTWLKDNGKADIELHYFDNLPTASVSTRAKELRVYLEKRRERETIQKADRVALVGHSTGGLDIRQLILDLDALESPLLDRVQRIAFLSVPQRGTNIADWVKAQKWLIAPAIGSIARGLELGVEPTWALESFEWFTELVGRVPPNIVEIILDVVKDFERRKSTDPWEAAKGREAFSQLALWFENIDHDFLAIPDLASTGQSEAALQRAAKIMTDNEIWTRTYATLGRCPHQANHLREWRTHSSTSSIHLGKLMTQWFLEWSKESDLTYALGYALCANGPFKQDGPSTPWIGGGSHAPFGWENDGIVNTASMICREFPTRPGEDPVLVPGDHGDIMGHFREGELQPNGVMRTSYDLLRSTSSFDERTFATVWRSIFDHAVS